MHEDLDTFIRVGFSADSVGQLEGLRDGLALRNAEDLAVLREGFRELVEQRTLSLREFAMMCDLDFETEDEQYAYLSAVYQYMFEGAETPPEPPY